MRCEWVAQMQVERISVLMTKLCGENTIPTAGQARGPEATAVQSPPSLSTVLGEQYGCCIKEQA